MRLKPLGIICTILRHCLPAFAFPKCFQASWKSWNTSAVTEKRSGTPRALWTFCQNKSVGLLRSANSWKWKISNTFPSSPSSQALLTFAWISEEVWWEFLDIVLETRFPCAPIRQTQFITTRPRPLNCAPVIQSFKVLNVSVSAEGKGIWEVFFKYLCVRNFSKQ